MKKYVSTDYTGCDYITAGKLYELVSGNQIIADDGCKIWINPVRSAHIGGNAWTVHEVGTLAELDVKAGDVVEFVSGNGGCIKVGTHLTVDMDGRAKGEGYDLFDPEFDETYDRTLRIISRATTADTKTPFGELTDAEQAALLLAHHRGERIEYMSSFGWDITLSPLWCNNLSYRIKPAEPKREVLTMYAKTNRHGEWIGSESRNTMSHEIIFDTVDGEPDCSSVRMYKL